MRQCGRNHLVEHLTLSSTQSLTHVLMPSDAFIVLYRGAPTSANLVLQTETLPNAKVLPAIAALECLLSWPHGNFFDKPVQHCMGS